MLESESPEERRRRIVEEVQRKLREAGEDAAEYIPTPKLDQGLESLLKDIANDPYAGQTPYEAPKITKHDGLGQVAFSAREED